MSIEIIEQYNNLHTFLNKFNVVKFMNHGFFPNSKILKKKDLLFKYEATLYLELLKNIETKNLILLDIGCGRGGGLDILKKYLKLKKVYGCDINNMAIEYCKKNYKDIDFKVCSSEKLTYDSKTFDLVTNVESFHCYKNKNNFFKEVARVLKSNGHLLITDVNLNFTLDNSFKDYFKVTNVVDITPNVAFACKHNIQNFCENIKDKEMRSFLVNLREEKFYSYLRYDTYFIMQLTKI